MTPEEQAALVRQKRIARTPELKIEKHLPAPGQMSFLDRSVAKWERKSPSQQAGKGEEING